VLNEPTNKNDGSNPLGEIVMPFKKAKESDKPMTKAQIIQALAEKLDYTKKTLMKFFKS
jgi:hypothetical protein